MIAEGRVGVVVSKEHAEISTGNILARREECDNFQDDEKFLISGGQRGRRTVYITAGSYRSSAEAYELAVKALGHFEEPRSGGDEGMYDLQKHLLSSGHTSFPRSRVLRSNILSSGRLVGPNDSCARHPFEVLRGTLWAERTSPATRSEKLSKGRIKLVPDVLIGGGQGGGTAIDGLLGLKLMELIDPKKPLEGVKRWEW